MLEDAHGLFFRLLCRHPRVDRRQDVNTAPLDQVCFVRKGKLPQEIGAHAEKLGPNGGGTQEPEPDQRGKEGIGQLERAGIDGDSEDVLRKCGVIEVRPHQGDSAKDFAFTERTLPSDQEHISLAEQLPVIEIGAHDATRYGPHEEDVALGQEIDAVWRLARDAGKTGATEDAVGIDHVAQPS